MSAGSERGKNFEERLGNGHSKRWPRRMPVFSVEEFEEGSEDGHLDRGMVCVSPGYVLHCMDACDSGQTRGVSARL
jgi:hypothetical protein